MKKGQGEQDEYEERHQRGQRRRRRQKSAMEIPTNINAISCFLLFQLDIKNSINYNGGEITISSIWFVTLIFDRRRFFSSSRHCKPE
jgi:hypothetical protein